MKDNSSFDANSSYFLIDFISKLTDLIHFETTQYIVCYLLDQKIGQLWWIRSKKQAYSDSNFSLFVKNYLLFGQSRIVRRKMNMFKMTTKNVQAVSMYRQLFDFSIDNFW